MSVEKSFEAWEEVQRQGQDLADRLAQGFSGLIQSHPPVFPWPNPQKSNLFDLEFPVGKIDNFGVIADNLNGINGIFDMGNRIIGQAGADLGACVDGLVQQFFRKLPFPFGHHEGAGGAGMEVVRVDRKRNDAAGLSLEGELGLVSERLRDYGFVDNDIGNVQESSADEIGGFNLTSAGHPGKPQGVMNITSTYDSRTHNIESSLVARGDLWRVEASQGGSTSTSGHDNSSLFLIQLGPVLFVRDSTLLLPVHLSKQHLLWYGYDRKNGIHSLCPAVWSKHRRWLFMSMFCLNPLACSFMDVQFPNGQFTYVSGEGLTTSAFLPVCGGLLQVQGQCPGEMRFSFSHKNKWGTRITPMVQWPDKSFTLGLAQALAWQRSGLMVRPTVQFSLCPTFGGSNPGLRAELIHSMNEKMNMICGCAVTAHPSLFASLSIGRSKWNGNVGKSGVVLRLDTPLSNVGQPSFSVQINSGIEF